MNSPDPSIPPCKTSSCDSQLRQRRGFLTGAAGSGLALSLGLSIADIQRSVAAESGPLVSFSASEDEFTALADQYLLDPKVVYLNHASIGTIAKPVQAARAKYLNLCETNPWLYMWGEAWDEPREQTRTRAADFLNVDARDIAITHNTTEIFNTAANGLPLEAKDEVLFSSLCHAGASLPFVNVAATGRFLTRRFEFPIDQLPAISDDQIIESYRNQIKPQTRVLVIPHLDNTVGLRYPVRQLVEMAREQGVQWVLVDAAQTVGMLPVDAKGLGVDLLATSPHKWLGAPKGIGLSYVAEPLRKDMRPMWVTWGQQRWGGTARIYEDYGTRNLAEVLTLGDAIDFNKMIVPTTREQRLRDLWQSTHNKVLANKNLDWKSPDRWELAGSLYCIGVKQPAAALAKRLFQDHGIVVRPFNTLGLNHLRVSPNIFTSNAQIDRLLKLIS